MVADKPGALANFLVVSLTGLLTVINSAVTVLAAFMVTSQVLLPLQAPLHWTKVLPALGVAVNVWVWFWVSSLVTRNRS